MRKTLLLTLILAFPLLGQEALTRHTIQARVNNRIITSGEVLRQVKGRWEQLESQRPPELWKRKIEAWIEARKELVEEALLVSAGEELAKKFPRVKDFIDRSARIEIEEQRRELGGESKLRDFIEQKLELNYSEYIEKVRRTQLRNFVLQREIFRPVEIRLSDIRDFYHENLERFRKPGRVRYRRILLRVESEDELDARMALARELAERARNGDDFQAVAAAFSDAWENGEGEPEERRLESLAAPLRETLETLAPGEVSAPLLVEDRLGETTRRDILLLQLVERADAENVSFKEAQDTIRRELVAEQQARRYQALVKKLRETNYVWEME